MTERAYVALGSNVGNRAAYLAAARTALASSIGVTLVAATLIEETAALGDVAQGPYLNQMVAVDTTLEPRSLLARTQEIERALGRVRARRWGPRTIDLDLVSMGTREIVTDELVLPHPGIASRDFWQREIAELDMLLPNEAVNHARIERALS